VSTATDTTTGHSSVAGLKASVWASVSRRDPSFTPSPTTAGVKIQDVVKGKDRMEDSDEETVGPSSPRLSFTTTVQRASDYLGQVSSSSPTSEVKPDPMIKFALKISGQNYIGSSKLSSGFVYITFLGTENTIRVFKLGPPLVMFHDGSWQKAGGQMPLWFDPNNGFYISPEGREMYLVLAPQTKEEKAADKYGIDLLARVKLVIDGVRKADRIASCPF